MEQALARQANRVLFCDTDLLTTTIWSDVLFGQCPDWIKQRAAQQRYHLTLLTDIDVPWVADAQRFLPERRQWFFDRCIRELEALERPYVIVGGSWQQRLASAYEAVDRLFAEDLGLAYDPAP